MGRFRHVGLLPEPARDASGYRQYGAQAVVSLTKIRAVADAGVSLSQIGQMLNADSATFAETVERIDARLRDEIERLYASRRQVAQLAAGDSLALPPEIGGLPQSTPEMGTSEPMMAGERDGWILIAARWPDKVVDWMPDKLAQLQDPRVVRLYQVLSELMETDGIADQLAVEAVDIIVELAEQAGAAAELDLATGSATTHRSHCWTTLPARPTNGSSGCGT